jgi:hypothetical protein
MSKRKVVTLQTAYHWFCNGCSGVNFSLPQKAELTDEEAEEAYRNFYGLDKWADLPENWKDFEMVEIPEIVVCEHCDAEFHTMHENEMEDLDE